MWNNQVSKRYLGTLSQIQVVIPFLIFLLADVFNMVIEDSGLKFYDILKCFVDSKITVEIKIIRELSRQPYTLFTKRM